MYGDEWFEEVDSADEESNGALGEACYSEMEDGFFGGVAWLVISCSDSILCLR